MDWVLSFGRAKKAFEDLIKTRLTLPVARDILKKKLTPYRNRSDLVAWNAAGSDFFRFHQMFQFQLIKVNATWGQRIEEFLIRFATAGGVPDDLTAALGSFNLYAAIQYAYLIMQIGLQSLHTSRSTSEIRMSSPAINIWDLGAQVMLRLWLRTNWLRVKVGWTIRSWRAVFTRKTVRFIP